MHDDDTMTMDGKRRQTNKTANAAKQGSPKNQPPQRGLLLWNQRAARAVQVRETLRHECDAGRKPERPRTDLVATGIKGCRLRPSFTSEELLFTS